MIIQTSEDAASFPLFLAWTAGVYQNVANSHQLINTGAWHTLPELGIGEVFMECQLKRGSVDHIVFSTNDTISWSAAQEIKFTGLGDEWATFSWRWSPNGNSTNIHFGVPIVGGTTTQIAGDALMKRLRIYRNTNTASISAPLTCQHSVHCERDVTANSFVSTSDRSIKKKHTECRFRFMHADFSSCRSENLRTH